MGFFDKLFGGGKSSPSANNQCPACGAMASVSAGVVRCSNPTCVNYAGNPSSATSSQHAGSKKGSFSPEKPIEIRYTNFRGEPRVFTSDAATLVRKKTHITAQVAPSGERIVLARNRIQNLSELEGAFPQPVDSGQAWPSARERQVLNYHKKYGSTSPLYEKVRAKYPNW
ncbi:MAG TPA: hypothetical protein VGL89_11880 [Candidatus Koribacter sp.]